LEDLIIGGTSVTHGAELVGRLPFGVSYNNTSKNVPGSATEPHPQRFRKMKTSLGGFNAAAKKRKFYDQLDSLRGHCVCTSPTGNG